MFLKMFAICTNSESLYHVLNWIPSTAGSYVLANSPINKDMPLILSIQKNPYLDLIGWRTMGEKLSSFSTSQTKVWNLGYQKNKKKQALWYYTHPKEEEKK